MDNPLLFSIIETPLHPRLSPLYQRLGLEERQLDSQRKAINALKKAQPAFIVAEFIYAYSTYYQATNISNLDVLLNSLVKYSPESRVIVLVKKGEEALAEKLRTIHPLIDFITLTSPIPGRNDIEAPMEALLS